MASFGAKLNAIRITRQLTPEVLAERMTGDSAATDASDINDMEANTRNPTIKQLRAMVNVLDVTAEYLLDRNDSPDPAINAYYDGTLDAGQKGLVKSMVDALAAANEPPPAP